MHRGRYSIVIKDFGCWLQEGGLGNHIYLVLNCSEELLIRPNEVYFYCAPTYRMAKDIAWKELKRLTPNIWIKSKNETDLRLELINGSTIELKGTENAMALRGRSLAGVVLDEAAFMDRDVWAEVIRPASG